MLTSMDIDYCFPSGLIIFTSIAEGAHSTGLFLDARFSRNVGPFTTGESFLRQPYAHEDRYFSVLKCQETCNMIDILQHVNPYHTSLSPGEW